jgi:phosphoserine phosphatase RsbU/P
MSDRQHVRVLLVEDNPHDAELIERHLRRAQLEVAMTVVDDEAGLRSMLENSDPDVILSDYSMPGFDGVTALRIARDLAPSTPFIFVSGSIGEERAVDALREGATDYVLKDRLSRLPSAVVRALAERRERSLRQSMESALRSSEQRFRYAAAATREIIWEWNLATSRIWFSDALRDLWGYDAANGEVDASWFERRIHPGDRPGVMSSFDDAVASKERWTADLRFARADGSYSNVLVRGMVVRDANGQPVSIIGAMIDITERLQLRLQLEQARRIESLGRVAATVAHEFSNVLMGILPFAELIRRRPDEGTIERSVPKIVESISRGRRLTEQILRFGKPAEPTLAPVDLGEWLEGFTPELRALAGDNVDVAVSLPRSSLSLLIDSQQMHQVLTNLVVNARDAMPAGGAISIGAEVRGETVTLMVEDNGTGMPPLVMEQIFEPLFTTKRRGTGLGLAVAQQVVALHGGSIHVTSALGQGTTFRIELPLAHV